MDIEKRIGGEVKRKGETPEPKELDWIKYNGDIDLVDEKGVTKIRKVPDYNELP